MGSRSITFYFDIESPFSYVAFEVLEQFKHAWNVDVTYKPVFIIGVFKAVGNRPPAIAVPVKGQYLLKDLRRTAELHGIPFVGLPANSLAHSESPEPFKSTSGLLLLVAALQLHGSDDVRCRKLIRKVFQNVMIDHQGGNLHLTSDMLLDDLRESGFGEGEAASLLKASAEPTCKAELRAATQEAVAEKAFGMPYMVLEGAGIPRKHRHWFGVEALYRLGLIFDHPIVQSKPGAKFVEDAQDVGTARRSKL